MLPEDYRKIKGASLFKLKMKTWVSENIPAQEETFGWVRLQYIPVTEILVGEVLYLHPHYKQGRVEGETWCTEVQDEIRAKFRLIHWIKKS